GKVAAAVRAVGFDRVLMPALREVVADFPNVDVVQADIRRREMHGESIVVGNIPYNLAGALIRKLLDKPPRPRRLSLVVQKEVAERWAATTSASLGTVAVQVFAEPRIVMSIPASSFTPPPKVDSALVILEVRTRPAVEVPDVVEFLRFVEEVFQFRRKQVGGTLARLSGLTGPDVAARLQEL